VVHSGPLPAALARMRTAAATQAGGSSGR
jgi:hypothetical protein